MKANIIHESSPGADPIAAIASGNGGAVAIIRVSGRASHRLLKACLSLPSQSLEARKLYLTKFFDPRENQTIIDEPLAVFFAGSASYTGEESAELHCHGGAYVLERVLSVLYRSGFREAQPGEFTKRAFLNGKLDLTQAEGLRELITAQSHQQWLSARQLLGGRLAVEMTRLRQTILGAMAYLEARIDFPDEGETSAVELDQVRERAKKVYDEITALLATYKSGKIASQGLAVALIGLPNAGKSTLLNTLLAKERAIVTDVPGTTRDYIEEACLISGRLIRLIDTAGIRDHVDIVEQRGVEHACQLAEQADLILFLYAANLDARELAAMDLIYQKFKKNTHVRVLTKVDLGDPAWSAGMVKISCQDGVGIAGLEAEIARLVDSAVDDLKDRICISSARHLHALEQAQKSLAAFFQADELRQFDECLAFELQEVARHLQSIIGGIQVDDIHEKIFSEFCVGK